MRRERRSRIELDISCDHPVVDYCYYRNKDNDTLVEFPRGDRSTANESL